MYQPKYREKDREGKRVVFKIHSNISAQKGNDCSCHAARRTFYTEKGFYRARDIKKPAHQKIQCAGRKNQKMFFDNGSFQSDKRHKLVEV